MNRNLPTVAVLLSSYNGERFIREQIDSILAQKNVSVRIFIRDDGSTDKTCNIINGYGSRVTLFAENNIGVGNSFMNLLYKAGTSADYYAFCDQDDVWLPEKLWQAVQKISGYTIPALYCSNQLLTDSKGNITGKRYNSPVNTTYMQILCNNRITGCTMLWNGPLQRILIQEQRKPSQELLIKRIHDVWVAMVASVTGKILYDSNAHILYRQHESNAVGAKETTLYHEWRKKIKNPALRNGRSLLAREISEKYGDIILDREALSRLQAYANYRKDQRAKSRLLSETTLISCYSRETVWQLRMKIRLHLF